MYMNGKVFYIMRIIYERGRLWYLEHPDNEIKQMYSELYRQKISFSIKPLSFYCKNLRTKVIYPKKNVLCCS